MDVHTKLGIGHRVVATNRMHFYTVQNDILHNPRELDESRE